ncbi:MAG TPA: hypothetical protein VMU53_17910 [Candidatus Sulfotelmatobacter sp.]|nr:hypothetical protein [Candidatus Sulfotelmatobacter sp.]
MTVKPFVRIAVVILVLSVAAPLSRNQEYDRRDGNWWRQLDAVAKANYLAGFLDGMELGNRVAFLGADGSEQDYKAVSGKAAASFAAYRSKYLVNVTGIRLTDALDDFYNDSRNRQILVHDGVWLVLNQLAGKPDTVMQPLLETMRKDADKDRTGAP